MQNLKRNETNELTYKTEIDSDLENKLVIASRGRRGAIVKEIGMDVYTVLYLNGLPTGTYCIAWEPAQRSAAEWVGGEVGGGRIHVYVWPSPFTIHQKLSQHCYSAVHQHKIKKKNLLRLRLFWRRQ